MDLSIIIVNWNVKDLLEKCLASIYEQTQNLNFEVIVVDNASSDGSAEMIKNKFPQVCLIANKKNRWFAGGNNQGLAAARGALILFLNPDIVVIDRAIEKMAEMMRIKNGEGHERHGSERIEIKKLRNKEIKQKEELEIRNWKLEINNIGILGCKLLNPDMTLQPSCRKLPHLSDQILILLKLHNFFPNLKTVKKYYMSDFTYDDTCEVEQVMGACLMTRKEIIDQIGGLDEDYGSIFEEVDFCRRVGNTPITPRHPTGLSPLIRGEHGNTPLTHFRGEEKLNSFPSTRGDRGVLKWKIFFTDKAQVIHHKGQSFRQKKIITNQKNFNYAVLRYFKKYKPFWQYLILLCLWPISMALAIADQLMLAAGISKFKEKFKKREM